MSWLRLFIEFIKDPKVGPRLLLGLLAFLFIWIGLMQGVNANLWSNDPQLENLPATYQEHK